MKSEHGDALPAPIAPGPISFSYRCGALAFRTLFQSYFGVDSISPENVPLTGPAILAANHASFLDPPLIGCLLPRDIHYLARESLFRFPGIGTLLRSWNAVPVDRDGGGASGLRNILTRLRQGGAIILFPEGTRTSDGAMQPARSGIGLTVVRSQAPVIPVRVFGTYEAFSRHHRLPRPKRVAVKYEEPMGFAAERLEASSCDKARLKELYQEVADQIMEAIRGLERGEA